MIRSNFSTCVNVIFEETLALGRVRHTVSSKRVVLQTKMYHLVSYRCKVFDDIPVFLRKENFHANCTDRSQISNQ